MNKPEHSFPIILFPPAVLLARQQEMPPPRPPLEPIQPQRKTVPQSWLILPILACLGLIFINILTNYSLFGALFAMLLLGATIPISYLLFYRPQQAVLDQNYQNELQIYKEEKLSYKIALQKYQARKQSQPSAEEKQLFYSKTISQRLAQAIKTPSKLRRAVPKGRAEEFFLPFLYKHLGKEHIKTSLQLGKFEKPFVPDFCYIDESRAIYIDIEIDEPYTALGKEPIHYIGADEQRNDFFLSCGWTVVRFAEEQIVKYPEACCATIQQVLDYLHARTAAPIIAVPVLPHWSKKDAMQMAAQEHRLYYK